MVKFENISCNFGGLVALDDVSLEIGAGRILGLLGENGAGKTTLMNALFGLVTPSKGTMRIDGQIHAPTGPRDAMKRGIGMVHQHFRLVPTLTVAQNIVLGSGGLFPWTFNSQLVREIAQVCVRFNIPVDVAVKVQELSVGEQQRVEIIKALFRGARILILDEPTAVLTPAESEQLFVGIRRLRDQGVTVVLISHKLSEITGHCDDLAILRRGKLVHAGPAAALSAPQMAELMVGRPVTAASRSARSEKRPGAAPALELRRVVRSASSPGSLRVTSPLDLVVEAGEIVGIAGVDGNGQEELVDLIVGVRKAGGGMIRLAGADVTRASVAARINAGLAHICGDRQREGLVLSASVIENAGLKWFSIGRFARFGWLARRAVRREAERLMTEFDVRAMSSTVPVAVLSGGNQQKLIVARELSGQPRVVVAVNPTRGVDIGATSFIRSRLVEIARNGAGVLLVSTDLDEVLELSDRVAVIYNGEIRLSQWPEAGVEEIGSMMTGVPVSVNHTRTELSVLGRGSD